MKYAIAFGMNMFFGFYLHVIKPVQTYSKGWRMGRQLRNMRNAGLLLVLFVGGLVPLHAQTTEHFQARKEAQLARLHDAINHLTPQYRTGPNQWVWRTTKGCDGDGCIISVFYLGHGRYQATWYDGSIMEFDAPEPTVSVVERDGDWAAAQGILRSQGFSRGDDGLIYKIEPQEITGIVWLDNAFRYVWNNCGKLMILFGLLAVCYLLAGKLERSNQCYGDVLREEAADRWEEENGDEMHNPFDSPEGMQPATQYIPVRTKR